MEIYEVEVKALAVNTFRVIASNQREAAERATQMFRNDNLAKLIDLQFEVHADHGMAQ